VNFELTLNKPNVLTGLNQNGERSGVVFEDWATMDVEPPAELKGPTRSEIQVEQGKPVVPPRKWQADREEGCWCCG